MAKTKNAQVMRLVEAIGVDEKLLEKIMVLNITKNNLYEFGRFSDLTKTVDKEKAKAFFEARDHESLPPYRVPMKAADLLERFILEGGFDIDQVVFEDKKNDKERNYYEWENTLRHIETDREPVEGFVTVSVKIPKSMLAEIDAVAEIRSDFVRTALKNELLKQREETSPAKLKKES